MYPMTPRTSLRPLRRALLGAALSALLLPAGAATDIGGPIRIIVGVAAGGGTDMMARSVGRGMEAILKRPVVIENRPGAGGNIAAELVARSAPNGQTLLMSFTSHTINASLYKKLPFDPVKDFAPITMIATAPSVLVAHQSVPANTLPELLDYARKNPAKLNFALAGSGSAVHMAGEQLKMMAGVNIVNVGYKGATPALTDLLAGHIELMFATTANVLPHVGGGKLKVLGVTSPTPMPQFPGVPPIGETVKGFEATAWYGLFGPAGMSPELVQTLYDAARRSIEDPDFVKKLRADGATPRGMPPAQFAEFIARDIPHWAKVVKFSGAVAE